MIKCYIPAFVAPSKLDLLIARVHPQPLAKESQTKLEIILDIIEVSQKVKVKLPTPSEFYCMYDMPIGLLERLQYEAHVEYNTKSYHGRIQGEDF